MGLSILIPVYNFQVSSLVNALAGQLIKTGREGEIILFDDGSDTNYTTHNKSIRHPLVSYHQNPSNEGRMRSRLRLAALARNDYLLFLDCDSGIIKDDFVSRYLDLMDQQLPLASGGRVYDTSEPGCAYRLHWKYGTAREGRAGAFQSNNFLVQKKIFEQLDHTLQLPGYGHEDSWWGIQFENAGIRCRYIDNPVLHLLLETNEAFLQKSVHALGNLLMLEKKAGTKSVSRSVKIFRWYAGLKRFGLAGLFLFMERFFHHSFRKNLLSCRPRLTYFDYYRLAELIRRGQSVK